MNLEGVLEGLLFVQGDEGVTLESICDILEIDKEQAKELLMKLRESYEQENRGMRIRFLGNAFNYFTGTSTDIPNGAMWTYDDNVVVPVYRKDDCKK